MDAMKLLKKYWWIVLLLAVAIIGNLLPKKVTPRNYVGEAKSLIESMRNPSSVENLNIDYANADTLFKAMSLLKDSTSNDFLMSKDELEALLTYKVQNIQTETKKLRLKRLFSAYDNSCPTIERAIKKSMNNPKSYEHVETKYDIKGESIMVYCKFRGTNAFNAIVQGVAYGVIDFDGNLLEFKM